MDIQPRFSHVIKSGQEVDIPIEQIQEGDLFIVKSGERIPVDGVVVEGRSSSDQSMITSESIPVEKNPKYEVVNATINMTEMLKVKATKVDQDTALAQIVKLVEEAQIGN
ncbi:MAG: P-type Cu+ transporter [Thermoproteota archaeon]|nr:P-type Cu+ transporter [Thermoproteota archaeon]